MKVALIMISAFLSVTVVSLYLTHIAKCEEAESCRPTVIPP